MVELQRVQTRGWRSGLTTLLRSEFGHWWRTSRWLILSLVWIALSDGMIALTGITLASVPDVQPGPAEGRQMFGLIGMIAAIGAIIVMQNVIVGDKESGVAGWLLSKPVSRPAYILSKFASNAVGLLVTAVVIPGILAYPLVSLLFADGWLAPVHVAAGIGILALDALFYISLTLMLGAFFNHRGVVLAFPLGLVFLQQPLVGLVKPLIHVVPYSLSALLAGAAAFGEPLPLTTPIFAAVGWTIVFVALAVWRFGREEF